MPNILTHDRILIDQATATGVLAASKGILWGQNALQNLTIGRHTPRDPVQAIGLLGIVDYTSGSVTSDANLETILVEGCDKAVANSSAYKYAAQQMTVGSESYVLTSAAVGFTTGSPATASYGWLTSGLATYLDVQAAPTPSTGEESDYCVVMGDDGSGIELVPTWQGTAPTANANGIPIITSAGAAGTTSDNGIPAGVQSLNFSATINRDQVMDIRSSSPVQFVTTYPIDISMDLELYCLPGGAGENGYDPAAFVNPFNKLTGLAVGALALAKHQTGGATTAASTAEYVKAIGLIKTDESEGIQVGRYLSYTLNYTAADLLIPLPAIT